MKSLIKTIGVALILAVSVISCNSNKSVQQYLLEKQDSSDFVSLTLPASILNIAVDSLDSDQKAAVNSLKKLTALVYHAPKGDTEAFTKEKTEITSVLKNSKYQDLMRAQTDMGTGKVMFLGTESKIDEFLAYGSEEKENFILIRVIGDNMNPKHIKPFITALQQSDVNEDELLGLLSSLKKEN
jgi:hypothetical protein